MSKIQPINLLNAENMFKAKMKNGKEIAMRFAKENGQLKTAKIYELKAEKEDMTAIYSFGSKNCSKTPAFQKMVNDISNICKKAQEGAKLFADIMGWIK